MMTMDIKEKKNQKIIVNPSSYSLFMNSTAIMRRTKAEAPNTFDWPDPRVMKDTPIILHGQISSSYELDFIPSTKDVILHPGNLLAKQQAAHWIDGFLSLHMMNTLTVLFPSHFMAPKRYIKGLKTPFSFLSSSLKSVLALFCGHHNGYATCFPWGGDLELRRS
ncbi:hypothetical protein BDB01DRAFT_898639 [Pilobolus umbonatus]|nr:hypothetical protein BDB01DRAFT_898639 [Pilobolus umbonatus]